MDLADTDFPVIGMVHLRPLPGAPDSQGIDAVLDRAKADAGSLEAGGVDAILVENFGDAPFYPDDVPKHTVAAMTRVVTELGQATDLPIGVNVLRNDVRAAICVAAAADGAFVRANVHAGARATDQGVIEGKAHETIRLRERLNPEIGVFADIDVKHSSPLSGDYDAVTALEDAVERGKADAVVLTGGATGDAAAPEYVRVMSEAAANLEEAPPVLLGSGVTADNVPMYVDLADGAIVGSAFKPGGDPRQPVDEELVEELVGRVRSMD